MGPWTARVLFAAALPLAACTTTQEQLEKVAKDWCLTIRASQVVPVYPLTEDLQPGDVYMVPVPTKEQTRLYEEKGFLALDTMVARLGVLPYDEFYGPAYWTGDYVPPAEGHARPMPIPGSDEERPVRAPRAAFPSYNFSVDRSGGLKLALPLSGVPVGLGLMGASSARGSVTIRDAYTYGLDGERVYRRLLEWLRERPDTLVALVDVARQIEEPVYLRTVTRVYLTGGVTVSLVKVASSGGGLDAGAAPELELLELTHQDPAKAVEGAEAFGFVKQKVGGVAAGAEPGLAVQFVQASRRAVTMNEDFDRPLVIGYLGFDVKVFPDGGLSAPIPTYATLNETAGASEVSEGLYYLGFSSDESTEALEAWLDEDEANYDRLVEWLDAQGRPELDPSDLLYGADHAELRALAVDALVP